MTAFRIIVVLLGLIPLFLGGTGVLFGAVEHSGGIEVTAALDSQYRYLAAVYVAVGGMMIWSAGDVQGRALLFRFAMLGWFLGGLARALSWMTVGEPAEWQVSGMIIELVVPAIMLIWQMRLTRRGG